jgi:hypothetical protein
MKISEQQIRRIIKEELLAESYYEINFNDPLPIESVITMWKRARTKAYDFDPSDGSHGRYNTLDLDKYRKFNIKQLENPPGSEKYEELKNSVEKNGFTDPITLEVKKSGTAEIVDGNHRHQIALELGLADIPVIFSFK